MERNRLAHCVLEIVLQNLTSKFSLHGATSIHENMEYRINKWNAAAVVYDFYEGDIRETSYHLFTEAEDEAGDKLKYTIDISDVPGMGQFLFIMRGPVVVKEVEYRG